MAIMSKEYYADIESVYKKPEDYELAGKGNAYIRIDAEAKVTGTAVYTDDVYLPGMYYCKLVHSPYAHALIKSIDFSEALKVPGVKGVLTGADFPEGHNLGNPEAFKELADKEPLCRKKVRMVGDEVAAVCATTEEIATYAASLVKVEYEPLEPVLDPFYSMQPDAPAIHYPGTSNLSIFTTMKAGDPDKAFAEAYYTDKHYYRTQEMVHAAIEPHGAVAKYENGEWTGFDAEFARMFAKELGVDCEFFVIADWGQKFFELDSKNIDAIWNGMTITDEVTLNTSCSNPYVVNAQVVIMKADVVGNYTSTDSLKDLTFAVESGSAGEDAVKGLGISDYVAVQDQTKAVMEVSAGTADACVVDITLANAMTGEGTNYDDLASGTSLTSEEYGVGFRKESDLTDAFNKFMEKCLADGSLQALADKYSLTLVG